MLLCNPCRDMQLEQWPKNALAARCMDTTKPLNGIQPYGRTIDVFKTGQLGAVHCPAWCPKKRGEEK